MDLSMLKDPVLIGSMVFWCLTFFAWRRPTEARLEKLEKALEEHLEENNKLNLEISLIRQKIDLLLERME